MAVCPRPATAASVSHSAAPATGISMRSCSSTPTTGSAPTRSPASAALLEASPWAVAAVGAHAFVQADGRIAAAPPPRSGCLLDRLLVRNLFVNGGQLLIAREAVEATGPFRCDLTFGEDWEYWTRLALLGRIRCLAPASSCPVRARARCQRLSPHGDRSAARHHRPQRHLRQRPPACSVWITGNGASARPRGSGGRLGNRAGACSSRPDAGGAAMASPVVAPGAQCEACVDAADGTVGPGAVPAVSVR